MIVQVGDKKRIANIINGETSILSNSEEWYVWMSILQNLSNSTIEMYMKSMDRFLNWSHHNPPQNESFAVYIAKYRNDLLYGYTLYEKVYDDLYGTEMEFPVFTSKPIEKATVNKELAGIESYLRFIEDDDLMRNEKFVDIVYERKRGEKSFLAGIDIKKSSSYLETFGKRKGFIVPYKAPKDVAKIRYFPPELYDSLLNIANPRQRLLYLLCGATSARIGQALNLTIYDIDFKDMQVWLLDPTGDDKGLDGIPRRLWLLDKYGIDAKKDKPHNHPGLRLKYPIPLNHEPLTWIGGKTYRQMFFDTWTEYRKSKFYVSEFSRFPAHPFAFTTSSGNRFLPADASKALKSDLLKLIAKSPGYEYILECGFHSLRHMFGHIMAEAYAMDKNDNLIFMTKEAMGHSNLDSTLRYFKLSKETKYKLIAAASSNIIGGGIDNGDD
jgi:integrase